MQVAVFLAVPRQVSEPEVSRALQSYSNIIVDIIPSYFAVFEAQIPRIALPRARCILL